MSWKWVTVCVRFPTFLPFLLFVFKNYLFLFVYIEEIYKLLPFRIWTVTRTLFSGWKAFILGHSEFSTMYMDCYLAGRFSTCLMLTSVYGMLLYFWIGLSFPPVYTDCYLCRARFSLEKRILKSPLFFARFWRFLIKFTWPVYENLNFDLGFCIQAVTLSFPDSLMWKKKNLSGGFCYWLFFLFVVVYFSSSQEVQMLP